MNATTTVAPTASAQRIVDFFLTIDIADVEAGIAWYPEAYGIAEVLGIRYGVTTDQAAGILAALSPMNNWEKNVKDAERWLATRASVHTGSNLRKCERILAGESVPVVLNALKTVNFHKSIMTEGAEGICIDRHAYDIALGVRHTDKGRSIGIKAYRECAEAYREAADILAGYGAVVTPAEVQSVTWEAWRKVWGGTRHAEAIAA